MTVDVTLRIPESALSVFRSSADEFAQEMRIAAAVKWYETGRLSQSKAAELTELSRSEFLDALHRYGVAAFQVTPEDLTREVENA